MLGTETFDGIIYFLDFLFLVLLFVEIVLMMMVRGVFSPPPAAAYFRRNKGFGWRLCDCFICLTALIALSMDLSGARRTTAQMARGPTNSCRPSRCCASSLART